MMTEAERALLLGMASAVRALCRLRSLDEVAEVIARMATKVDLEVSGKK